MGPGEKTSIIRWYAGVGEVPYCTKDLAGDIEWTIVRGISKSKKANQAAKVKANVNGHWRVSVVSLADRKRLDPRLSKHPTENA